MSLTSTNLFKKMKKYREKFNATTVSKGTPTPQTVLLFEISRL